jgi:hypothetical protein
VDTVLLGQEECSAGCHELFVSLKEKKVKGIEQ